LPQQGNAGTKSWLTQIPPVLNWECWLAQVDLYNGHKAVVHMLLLFFNPWTSIAYEDKGMTKIELITKYY